VAKIEHFEDMECWKKARELTKFVYEISSISKFARDYGLRDQIRRASVSVLSNIAEGFERDGNKEFIQFLSLAKGSSGEVRAQLYVAFDQQYITKEQFELLTARAIKVNRIISGLIKSLHQSEQQGRKYK
jgi:four helix bundle protein